MRDAFARSVLWGFAVAAETRRPRAGRRDRVPGARRPEPARRGCGRAATSSTRRAAAVYMPRHHELPEEHRDRGRAHLRAAAAGGAAAGRRRAGRRRRLRRRALFEGVGERGGDRRGGEPARAPLVRRAARRQLQAARRRSARRLLRRRLPGVARRASTSRWSGASSARHRLEKRDPTAAVERRRSRSSTTSIPGAPEPIRTALLEGARWWNQAFEAAGFRNALPGRAAARRRRPDGHPLQHDQLGAPLDARLEHGRRGHRPAHRRDHQGRRDARLAARAPGLPDRRGPARALRDRRREPAAARRRGRSRASGSSRRTRSATRSGSRPQLLRQRARAGSR